jgi:hypothetical protein
MRKSFVAAQIQPDAAEEAGRIGDHVATALEHFYFCVWQDFRRRVDEAFVKVGTDFFDGGPQVLIILLIGEAFYPVRWLS